TQVTYRNVLERFRTKLGKAQIRHLKAAHIRQIIQERAKTPAAANSLLKRLRALMQFALEADLIKTDPTFSVRPIRQKTAGFHSWSEEEIEKFLDHHKPGSRAHLAFSLLLYTGQRRSDVVRMGRQHVRDGVLTIRQQKTGNEVSVPILAELAGAIAAVPADNLTFLRTAFGKPIDAAGFGNWFRAMCNDAGLPKHCSSHGLRKAAARRLAEAGCTSHEIAAITGHQSLKEVERYTRAFDRKGAGERAMEKLKTGTQSRKP
uniref:tyrosine-type recombinase/integrase n=1 Tax=Dongia sp. TaxID=1977262 RepID=UPI0034A43039